MTEETGEETFFLPDLGEGLSEAEIVRWHVMPGDRVVADQPLVTVETDKAVVDIPSPRNGVVEACLGQPGDVIRSARLLCSFQRTMSELMRAPWWESCPQLLRRPPLKTQCQLRPR